MAIRIRSHTVDEILLDSRLRGNDVLRLFPNSYDSIHA